MASLSRIALRSAVAGAALALLGACSDDEQANITYIEQPVEELYNAAVDQLEAGNWNAAARAFDEVERQHPYSVWATRAQLQAAYAFYEADDYDDAIIAADRFIRLHPGNKDVAYAYYLRALSYYEQISDVGRDQKMTRLAMENLQEVVTRFPNSEYARDARLKIDLTRDHLAGKEMAVGRYYLRQENYLAAINRFKRVVELFETTTHVPEALLRISESYMALGLVDQARTSVAVLGHNYPGTDWYQDAYYLVEGREPPEDGVPSGWLGLW